MSNFKKIALSFFVIIVFIFYALYQQRAVKIPVLPTVANSNIPLSSNPGSKTPAVSAPVASVSSDEGAGDNDSQVNDDNNSSAAVPVAPAKKAPAVSTPAVKTPVVKAPATPAAPAPVTPPAPVPVAVPRGKYKDGTYTGDPADAFYGTVQVQAVIKNGFLTDVPILNYPQDRNRSIQINSYAMPVLQSEAIQAQSAQVNTVSGASDSSGAFSSSLASALAQTS